MKKHILLFVVVVFAGVLTVVPQQRKAPFSVVEASISDMQQAMKDGRVSSRQLVIQYLMRIALYNKKLNAIISVNPDGDTYTNLVVGQGTNANILGLRFLARHLVTLDFPNRTMYLQRTSVRPLPQKGISTNISSPLLEWQEPAVDDEDSLAQRLISAPNLNPAFRLMDLDLVLWLPWRPRFLPLRILVGPPEAKLSALQLPPGNYRLKIVSKVNRTEVGDSDLSLVWSFANKGPAAPSQERATILLLHDYNSQKELLSPWAFLLAQGGYRVVLVDLRGHGGSTGETISYGKYETADLRQLLDCLEAQRVCGRNAGVLGVGYGADLALHWAARDPRIRTVVAIAPYNQPEQAFQRTANEHESSVSSEALRKALASVAARLDIQWTDWSGEAALRQLKQPVLLIGGGKDTICSTNDLKALEQAAPVGSRTLLIPEANHENIGYWFHEIAEPVKAWFQEQFSAVPEGQSEADRTTSPSRSKSNL